MKEKDGRVSHGFTQSALRVVLLLHGQLSLLRLIQLLLQDLDLLPHHLHDRDRFVFVKIRKGNRDKKTKKQTKTTSWAIEQSGSPEMLR